MNWTILGILLNLCGVLFNIAIFTIIKFNDLKHLTMAVERLISRIDIMDKSMTRIRERISRLEGKLGK